VENRLAAHRDGAGFGGTLTGPTGQASAIADTVMDGDTVGWTAAFTEPAPLSVVFNGRVDGDRMSGSLRAGSFPATSFTAIRLPQSTGTR
jgi:hypothetical protein